MPLLELLAAPPGTGKTSYCIDLFRKKILESKAGMDARAFFVLPSREHADRIQHLVLKKDIAGLFNVHLLTFNDLAMHLIGASGASHPNDLQRKSILREVLADPALSFTYFNQVKDFPGFHDLLVDTIKEFQASLLTTQEFENRAQELLVSAAFRSKFRDFSMILKNYDKRLKERGLREPEENISELLSRGAPVQSPDLVIFDGFYHFTHAQSRLLTALAGWSRHTVVTLTIPEKTGERPALFELTEKTRRFLVEAGFKQKKGFKDSKRVSDASLVHLERNIFSEIPKKQAAAVSAISLLEASSVKQEIEMIAREIKRAHREGHFFHSDVCVILRHISEYEKLIYSVFEDFGIPVHVHERKKLIDQGLSKFVYRCLNLFVEGWRRDDVFAFLKSSYLSLAGDIHAYERVTLSMNIRDTRDQWLAAASADPAFASISTLLSRVASLEDELLSAHGMRPLSLLLFRWLDGLELRDSDKAPRASIELLLKNMARFEGQSPVVRGPQIFRQIQEAMEAALFSDRPVEKNRVQVYDVVMALPKEYKIVFMAGLLEKVFPQQVSEHALFKDDERRVINRQGTVLEERRIRAAGERYFFYMGLTRAREKLYLSYPKYNAKAQPTLPSFFIEEVAKCFSKPLPLKSESLSEVLPEMHEWETEREVTRGLSYGLFSSETNTALQPGFFQVLSRWSSRDDFRRVLESSLRSQEAVLRDPSLREKFRNLNTFSATRLETFALCAFRYFAGYMLELEPPLEGREHIDMGKLLHKVLELFYLSALKEKKPLAELWKDETAAKQRMLALMEAEIEPYFHGEPLYRRKIFTVKVARLLEAFIRREKELSGKRSTAPTHFEWTFGRGAENKGALKITEPGGDILISGQIDRIDVLEGDKALVVDYKKSTRDSTLDEKIKKGLEFQLPIYLLAAQRLLDLEPIGAELRYIQGGKEQGIYRQAFAEKLGLHRNKKTRTEEEFFSILTDAEDRIKKNIRRLRSADIAVKPKSCEFCHFDSVCRFEKWKLIYQREES